MKQPTTSGASAADSHPFTARDLVGMDRISDPAVSPDGKLVVYTVSALDLDANRRRSRVWLVGSDGRGLRRLTASDENDGSPAWSADGKWVYFLSGRSGSQQVWRLAADGGEAEAVTREPLDVGTFALSPDGKRIAYTMEVFPDLAGVAATRKRLDELKESKVQARVYERAFVRHWDTWADGRRAHLFCRLIAGGEAVDVTKGMDADIPSKPHGGREEITFTPDSSGLVYAARVAGREEAWSTKFDLYLAPADGSVAPRKLTPSNPAWDTMPVFSPDGKTLAYLATTRPGYEADRYRVVTRAWPDGPDKVLTEAWDRSPGTLTWSADGRKLYATAANLAQVSLFAIDAASGEVTTLIRDGHVRSPAVAGARIVYGLDTLSAPVDLYSAAVDGSDVRRLTSINAERLAAVRLGAPEELTFKGANGDDVHAWVVKPVDFEPAKRYPVAFIIHGGPQGSSANEFHYRWNPQTFAGRGYAVVEVDFHGSTGYGQAFCDAIRGDWGGKPLVDLQKGLEAALGAYAWMDGERVAGLGASYGGYMINCIAGNWADRFRCLVNHDGTLDERFSYFDTEELWFPEWEHEGTPWDNPRSYEKQNPVNFIKNWKTPMLVIHSGRDFRVVETQGLGTFNALQRRGIPSKLLYFPDENHWVLKPQNSLLWHETVLGWLDEWTKAVGK